MAKLIGCPGCGVGLDLSRVASNGPGKYCPTCKYPLDRAAIEGFPWGHFHSENNVPALKAEKHAAARELHKSAGVPYGDEPSDAPEMRQDASTGTPS